MLGGLGHGLGLGPALRNFFIITPYKRKDHMRGDGHHTRWPKAVRTLIPSGFPSRPIGGSWGANNKKPRSNAGALDLGGERIRSYVAMTGAPQLNRAENWQLARKPEMRSARGYNENVNEINWVG